MIGVNGDAYVRYERDEVRPTIEKATKISNAIKVSLYYLVGKTNQQFDDVSSRINEISKMNDIDKEHVFSFLDAFTSKTKIKELV